MEGVHHNALLSLFCNARAESAWRTRLTEIMFALANCPACNDVPINMARIQWNI